MNYADNPLVKKDKDFLIIFITITILVLNFVVFVIADKNLKVFNFDGINYRFKDSENFVWYFEDDFEDTLEIHNISHEKDIKNMNHFILTYREEVYEIAPRSENDFEGDVWIYTATNHRLNESIPLRLKLDVLNKIRTVLSYTENDYRYYLHLLSYFVIILGLGNIFSPKTIWNLMHFRKIIDFELTDVKVTSSKVIGSISILVGFFVSYLPYLIKR